MAGIVSLFQKYRSQSFADLVGQEVVVRTLSNAIKNGSPAQVYLFCGPRGTGKTSTARILAKALNCENGPTTEPCNECQSCRSISDGSNVDLIEIDAASNTQVDKIRDVIVDKVMYAPAHSRYKIFIIDEVHMLSQSSFNALLKTLEEPPAHVIFILATTDPHKLPATVLSRCQRHDFQRLTLSQIADRVKYVSEKEGLQCSDEAADMIARAADGSMRDALSELGAVAALADGQIDAEMVEMALGLSGSERIRIYTDCLLDGDAPSALAQLNRIVDSGCELRRVAGELCEHLRRLLLIMAGAADCDTFDISEDAFQTLQVQAKRFTMAKVMSWLGAVINLQSSLGQANNARVLWEMLTIRLAVPGADDTLQGLARRVERLEEALAGGNSLPAKEVSAVKETSPAKAVSAQAAPVLPKKTSVPPQIKKRAVRTDASVSAAETPPAEPVSPPRRSAEDAAPEKPQNADGEPSSDNLGWGSVSPRRSAMARPEPKKTPSAAAKAADRAIVSGTSAPMDPRSVRASWNTASRTPAVSAERRPSVPPASPAELKDLRTLWLGFLAGTDNALLQQRRMELTEAERFEFKDGVLDVYLPGRHARAVDDLVQETPELNRLIANYRSNITKLRLFAEESRMFADAGSKQEHDSLVSQVVGMFGAEIVDE